MSEPDLISKESTITTTTSQEETGNSETSESETKKNPKRTYGEVKFEKEISTYPVPQTHRPFIPPNQMYRYWQNFKNSCAENDEKTGNECAATATATGGNSNCCGGVGKMTAKELQQAFELFQGKFFSDSSCKFVVRLFDLDQNGGLDIREFELLYYYIKQWVTAFNAYDEEHVGCLDEKQLDFALKHMDIHFTPEFIRYLITRNNPNAKTMTLDQYIVTCIQIQRYTDEFKQRDTEYTGHIHVRYEDFLEMIMRCV